MRRDDDKLPDSDTPEARRSIERLVAEIRLRLGPEAPVNVNSIVELLRRGDCGDTEA